MIESKFSINISFNPYELINILGWFKLRSCPIINRNEYRYHFNFCGTLLANGVDFCAYGTIYKNTYFTK